VRIDARMIAREGGEGDGVGHVEEATNPGKRLQERRPGIEPDSIQRARELWACGPLPIRLTIANCNGMVSA